MGKTAPPTIMPSRPLRIAHAGGGLPGRIYNNSKEAIEANYALGFRWFEIDFIWRDDGVLITDGGRAARVASPTASYYDAKDESKAEGLSLDASACSMTLPVLADTLREYPDILIVTDVKEDNIAALTAIAEAIPDAASRIICQIFSPLEYEPVLALGFNLLTWTLYKYSGDDSDVLQQLRQMELLAVTMPIARAEAGLAHQIGALGVATYAHTVNDDEQLRSLQTVCGVSEVYSDFLAPSQHPAHHDNQADSGSCELRTKRAPQLRELPVNPGLCPQTGEAVACSPATLSSSPETVGDMLAMFLGKDEARSSEANMEHGEHSDGKDGEKGLKPWPSVVTTN